MPIHVLILLQIFVIMGLVMPGCGGAMSSPHDATHVASQSDGYVNEYDKRIRPVCEEGLIITTMPEQYSYEDLMHDVYKLESKYSDRVRCVKLCNTADGRGVYDIVLGDINGSKQVLIFGAMHAREYITTQIVMRQVCDAVDILNDFGTDTFYRGHSKKSLLEGVTVHFVPMNNPDGVSISQFGEYGIKNLVLRQKVAAMIDGDYRQWKANAIGVDLNRNFDADWQEFRGAGYPAAERYKGSFPGSEPESAALIELTKRYNIRRAISYHTCGALIYWYYKQTGEVLNESRHFAQLIAAETGYQLDDDYTAVDAAGYKDWAVYQMGVPAITIETGAENGRSIINPVPISRFNGIWERNKNIVYATAYDLL